MYDPSWFPSAVMQTIGALYGIFIAFFVLVLQRFNKNDCNGPVHESGKKFDKKINNIISYFQVLTIFVVFIELYNGALVYFVSDSIYNCYEVLLIISFILFVIVIVGIAAFTNYMVVNLGYFIKKTPDDLVKEEIDKNNYFDRFLGCIMSIAIVLVVIVWITKKHLG
jgi:hypothetical protein